MGFYNKYVTILILGLLVEDCDDLKSYVHYRKPLRKWNTNLIARKDYNYALDFLDTIDMDIPKGIHKNDSKKCKF